MKSFFNIILSLVGVSIVEKRKTQILFSQRESVIRAMDVMMQKSLQVAYAAGILIGCWRS